MNQLPENLSLQQQQANCLKLAKFLEELPHDDRFNMSDWITPKRNECGTSACAFGWAAHSKLFEGLATRINFDDNGEDVLSIEITWQGEFVVPEAVAPQLFGRDVYVEVFLEIGAGREDVIYALKEFGEHGLVPCIGDTYDDD